jgi:hypothetical protein
MEVHICVMTCSTSFGLAKGLQNITKLRLHHDCIIIFVLLLEVQNGTKESRLCLWVFFIQ